MPERIAPNVLSWASELDDLTREQAATTARLPILAGHLALMPDAHLGKGATIGSVIPTDSAVIPSAVGVDIGCGMAARRLDLTQDGLPDSLEPWVKEMESTVPAGLGRWHGEPSDDALSWFAEHPPPPTLDDQRKAAAQLGTLGSGNHFIELAADEDARIWILLHSGSRGGGNKLATLHTKTARKLHEGLGTRLEDPELAWLQEGTPEFDAYIRDLRWSQAFARENRRLMLSSTHRALETVLGREVATVDEVNCHHNFTEREEHSGRAVWVTRKGAIRARVGDRGLIPGAMGQRSYVIRGLGNEASYESCAHGAGRRMSRRQARKQLTLESFGEAMGAAVWQHTSARALLDEHPSAYKPIDVVMRDQADLVEIEHELHGIANYKGVERR
ncbi:MAG TPA: RtcB family protein [Actinomycetota bacterium]|nr:RtcB family protein [Actinomycetota bacterium]